jgi:hypothetical protein
MSRLFSRRELAVTFGQLLAIGIFVSAMTMSCSRDKNMNSEIDPTGGAVKNSDKVTTGKIDETTQAQIITLILRDLNAKDSAVMGEAVYLLLPESVFELLPREINGIKLVLLRGSPPDGKLKVDVLTFTNWKRSDDTIVVTSMAHFYGGNTSGCECTFTLVESNWIEQKRRCFAAAS